jgi:hypothetical protein
MVAHMGEGFDSPLCLYQSITHMTERELLNRIAELEQQLAEANARIDELIDLRPEN